MGIKSMIKVLNDFDKMQHPDRRWVSFSELQVILEALAEPEEGEEKNVWRVVTINDERWVRYKDIKRSLNLDFGACVTIKEESPDQPFKFGDLVEDEKGKRTIFLKHLDGYTFCWVLGLDSVSDFIGTSRNLKDLKLIQRGAFAISLKKMKEKLTGK